MIIKTVTAFVLCLAAATLIAVWAEHSRTVLFHSAYWGLIAAIIIGAVAGVITAIVIRRKRAAAGGEVPRHTVSSLIEHWGTAAGIVILMISGAMLASGRKIGFIYVPEFTRNRIMSLNLHYAGAFLTLIFGCYFLADFIASGKFRTLLLGPADIRDGLFKRYLLRQKWQDTGKYLIWQKGAFLIFSVLGIIVLVTGAIKTSYFVFQTPLNRTNSVHDIAAELLVLMLIVHTLLVIAVPSHWRLLVSWFTGKEGNKR